MQRMTSTQHSTVSINQRFQTGKEKTVTSNHQLGMQVSFTATETLQSLLPWVGNLSLKTKNILPFEDESPIMQDYSEIPKLISHHCRPPLANGRLSKGCRVKHDANGGGGGGGGVQQSAWSLCHHHHSCTKTERGLVTNFKVGKGIRKKSKTLTTSKHLTTSTLAIELDKC